MAGTGCAATRSRAGVGCLSRPAAAPSAFESDTPTRRQSRQHEQNALDPAWWRRLQATWRASQRGCLPYSVRLQSPEPVVIRHTVVTCGGATRYGRDRRAVGPARRVASAVLIMGSPSLRRGGFWPRHSCILAFASGRVTTETHGGLLPHFRAMVTPRTAAGLRPCALVWLCAPGRAVRPCGRLVAPAGIAIRGSITMLPLRARLGITCPSPPAAGSEGGRVHGLVGSARCLLGGPQASLRRHHLRQHHPMA